MAQLALRQVLTAIGDAAEATTADELIDAVLLATVSALAADGALVTQMTSTGAAIRSWPDDFLRVKEQLTREFQVAFAIPMDATRRICVTVNRCGREFSSDDLDVIEALRRPLAASAARLAQREKLSATATQRASLSGRELDVIALVASGLTNDQVGRRLGISARTVNKHLEHIFAKTGFRNRTEAASCWVAGAQPPAL